MVDGDDSFKRPGAVPFNWEIRPGVPKVLPDYDPTLLQPPTKLPPLRLKPLPPISGSKTRPISSFAPPPSFEIKPPPDSGSLYSGPPTPYFRSQSPREGLGYGAAWRRWRSLKSLFGSKNKSHSGDDKKTGHESTSSGSDNLNEPETTFSPSEDSSRGSVSTRWSSPRSSLFSHRGSPLKRNQSDLSSYEKKTILMTARDRLL